MKKRAGRIGLFFLEAILFVMDAFQVALIFRLFIMPGAAILVALAVYDSGLPVEALAAAIAVAVWLAALTFYTEWRKHKFREWDDARTLCYVSEEEGYKTLGEIQSGQTRAGLHR